MKWVKPSPPKLMNICANFNCLIHCGSQKLLLVCKRLPENAKFFTYMVQDDEENVKKSHIVLKESRPEISQ